MKERWRYRIAAVSGTLGLTATVIALVNNEVVFTMASGLPVLGQLASAPPHGAELAFEVVTATVAIVASMVPLYKPRPRRILNTITTAQRRVVMVMITLAAIGYFNYTYRLPRITVLLATPILLVVLPSWFVWIRRRPSGGAARAVVVGDDPEQVAAAVKETDLPLLGYLCPTVMFETGLEDMRNAAITDGGMSLERLGGLSRIEEVMVEYDVDTAILAFSSADRSGFYGTLDSCYELGVAAKVHREHADSVLTNDGDIGMFVDVDIAPWDVQNYLVKRVFDVWFSVVGLVGLLPVMAAIIVAIKVEDGGPVMICQKRTALFGKTFTLFKFRSMVEDAEAESGAVLSDEDKGGEDPRVTRVGGVLRRTHLDEIPQLWSVLIGDMSVVGPRPERPELEGDMELVIEEWRSRWFVKPGLTGLSQINDVTGYQPEAKFHYDLEYIRRQSFWFDVKIVIRQLWKVWVDFINP